MNKKYNKFTIKSNTVSNCGILQLIEFVLFKNNKLVKCKYKDNNLQTSYVIHNNLNRPSFVIFGEKGQIINYQYLFLNKLHRTDGVAFFDIKVGFYYYLNSKRYNKINYFLELVNKL